MSKLGKALISTIKDAINNDLIKLEPSSRSKFDWQTQAIEKAFHKANQENAKFVEHQEVSDWLNSWSENDNLEFSE